MYGMFVLAAAWASIMSAPRRNSPAAPVGEIPNGLENFLAEDRLRLVARRDIDKIARHQQMLVKAECCATEPALVLAPALDEVERDLRQPPFRQAVQVFDIDASLSLIGRVSR